MVRTCVAADFVMAGAPEVVAAAESMVADMFALKFDTDVLASFAQTNSGADC